MVWPLIWVYFRLEIFSNENAHAYIIPNMMEIDSGNHKMCTKDIKMREN